jgi:hypothetical protein
MLHKEMQLHATSAYARRLTHRAARASPERALQPLPQALEQHAEELVDVLSCYFPIVYTPPADALGGATALAAAVVGRQELVSAVQAALAATPAFAPHVVPLLLEKLTSSLT